MNNMGKAAVTYKPGSIIELAGIEFVVLENRGSELFILALKSQGRSIFGTSNNYAESKLKEAVDDWLYRLTEKLVSSTDCDWVIKARTIDLTTLDGHGKYGTLETKAAPLTMDEARKYADVIPDPDEVCWLATGWGGPGYFGSTGAFYVFTNGDWSVSHCSGSYGIRPALVISSLLLTSEEHQRCKQRETAIEVEEGDGDIPPLHKFGDEEDICPFCGGTIDYEGDNRIDDSGTIVSWTCPDCGAIGQAGYNSVFDRHYNVRDKDGTLRPEEI